MDKNLQYWSASGVNIFYLLWSNVFSLCQFENILLPVNDFQSSILYEADKSTCAEALVMVSVGRRERHWYCPYLKWFLWSSLFLFLGFGEMKSGFHKACLQKANQQASGQVPGACWVMQWLPRSVKTCCSSLFLITYFQLLHLKNSGNGGVIFY